VGKSKKERPVSGRPSSVITDSFIAASERAWEEWEEVKEKVFDDNEEGYLLIDIEDCRKADIMPIKRN
jgi:hypothetical protein